MLIKGYSPYVSYLNYLQKKAENKRMAPQANHDSNYGYGNGDREGAEMSYFSSLATFRDVLQAPLQPLIDNLESETYETFERDLFKYERYEEALYRAMSSMLSLGCAL